MYGRKSGSRHGPTSSLLLQQHLVNHYRHLQNVRPAIDTGHVTRHKRLGQRSVRQLQLQQQRRLALGSDSTASLQLIDRILNDIHCPPQYYCHPTVPLAHSEQCSETAEEVPDLHAPTLSNTLQLPTDDGCILKKIDSYLSAVRERRRFNLSSSTSGSIVGRRSITDQPPTTRPPVAPTSAARGRPLAARQPAPATSPGLRRSPARKLTQGGAASRPTPAAALHRPGRGRAARAPGRSPHKPGGPPLAGPSRQRQRPSRPLCRPAPATVCSVTRPREPSQPPPLTVTRPPPAGGAPYPTQYSDDETEVDVPDLEGRVPPLHMSPRSDEDQWPDQHRSPHTGHTHRQQHAPPHTDANNSNANHIERPESKDSAYHADFSCSSRAPSPGADAAAPPIQATYAPPMSQRFRPPLPVAPSAMPAARGTYRCSDDQAYVQFLNEVTSDILARGVFTNRIVKQVMAAHMERQQGVLNADRMRLELSHLREELGIPAGDEADDPEYGYGYSGIPLTACTHSARTVPSARPCCHLAGGSVTTSTLNLNHTARPYTARSRNITVRSRKSNPPMSVPAFVDSILFPRGGECHLPARSESGGGDSATCSAPVAPQNGATENVVQLLGDLSLDESITRTILRCYGDTSVVNDDTSINSEELQGALSDSAMPAEAS